MIALVIIVVLLINGKSEFKIDSENKYVLTTNLGMLTMESDGGTHTSEYYGIDLDKKRVYKYQDSYKGFEGYEYKGKMVKRKSLNDVEVSSIQNIFDDVISNNGQTEISGININFYTLDTKNNGQIKIYDKDIIAKLVDLLE